MYPCTILILSIPLALTLLTGCSPEGERIIKGTGSIVYLSFEGGFYGIRGDDGNNYDPVNLDPEFRIDGLRVQFELKELRDQASFHMWGTIVEIISIKKL